MAAAARACAGLASGASAARPEGTRLCVFSSSGWLNIDKPALQTRAAPGRIQIPVAFFLIQRPQGNVLFDTGSPEHYDWAKRRSGLRCGCMGIHARGPRAARNPPAAPPWRTPTSLPSTTW